MSRSISPSTSPSLKPNFTTWRLCKQLDKHWWAWKQHTSWCCTFSLEDLIFLRRSNVWQRMRWFSTYLDWKPKMEVFALLLCTPDIKRKVSMIYHISFSPIPPWTACISWMPLTKWIKSQCWRVFLGARNQMVLFQAFKTPKKLTWDLFILLYPFVSCWEIFPKSTQKKSRNSLIRALVMMEGSV